MYYQIREKLTECSFDELKSYYSVLAEKQNKNMSYLNIIATIFLPLTLMTGWYGMNFQYMPELDEPWAYYAFIAFSLSIAIGSVWFFKKKKWL